MLSHTLVFKTSSRPFRGTFRMSKYLVPLPGFEPGI